jgi:glucosamine-6-phosphate deaminase
MTSFRAGLLHVHVCDDRAELGQAAGTRAAAALRARLRGGDAIAAFFASAPSQTETLAALAGEEGIAWNRVTAFHLDEYVGASADSPHSFRRYLVENLLSKVNPAGFEGLRGEAEDLPGECARYGGEWTRRGPVVGLLGIGENGHIAFNDPPDSRFLDPDVVRIVELTTECRVQQVHDGTFPTLEAVPKAAVTVSISAIQRVPELFIMVPGRRKAEAIQATLEGPISEDCPASILRTHPNASLFIDRDSASLLRGR